MRISAVTALTAVAAAALLLRVPSVVEPLGIDQGLFASGARAMSRGYQLYRDVWDQKPPPIFLSYLAAFNVFGWTAAAIAWLDLLASAATTALLLMIARRLDGPLAGATAAALYAALTMPAWLYRNSGILERGVAETFICVCVALAAWCAAHIVARRDSGIGRVVLWAAGTGLAAGAAIAFKPNAGLYLVALIAWVWLSASLSRGAKIGVTILAAAAAAVAPALILVWLFKAGVWSDARVALFDFNRFYVAQDLSASRFAVDLSKALFLRMKTDPLWAAGSIAGLVAIAETARARVVEPLPALAVLLGGAAALVIAANGARLFNTYFIQAFPPLALAAAWLFCIGSRRSLLLRVGAVLGILVVAMLLVLRGYVPKVADTFGADVRRWRGAMPATEYLDRFGGYATGRGYSARANAELAEYVRARTTRDDLIYQFGINSSAVYFAADRLMAQRFLRVNEFVPTTFPEPGFDLASVARELSAKRPTYLIFEQLHTGTAMANAVDGLQQAPDLQPLLQDYRKETQIEDYTLYRRVQ